MLREISGKLSLQIGALVLEMQNAFEKNLPTYAGISADAKKDIRDLLENLALRISGFITGEAIDRQEFYAFGRLLGRNRSLQTIPFGDLVRAVFLVEMIIWNRIVPEISDRDLSPADWASVLGMLSDINANLIAALSASYIETKDEMIQRQLQELHGLLEVGLIITSTMDLDRVFHEILEVAAGIMQTPMGAVYLIEKTGDELELVSQLGLSPPWVKGRKVELSRSLLAEAIAEKAPVTGADERLRGFSLPAAVGGKVRSVLSCPIMKDEKPIGGLELYDVEARIYNRLDMALLAAFAPQAGVAIENARLFSLERMRSRQAQVMKDLAEGAAAALNFNQAMSVVVKKMAEVAEVDRVLLFSYQQEKNELQFIWGQGFSTKMNRRLRQLRQHPEEMDELTRRTILNGEITVVEDTEVDPRVNRDNARALGILSGLSVPIASKNQVTGMIILGDSKRKRTFTLDDMEMIKAVAGQAGIAVEQARLRQRIRDRERRLQELEASERVFVERERSETIISANPEAIFLVDRDRSINLFNPAAETLFGWKEDEALGRHAHEILFGETSVEPGVCGREGCPIDRVFRGERMGRWEMEYPRRDGSQVWISGSFSVIRNKKRQIEDVICVFRDITEQKRLQYLDLVDKELDIAAHIQSALLPGDSLENKVVRILAHQEQARLVGGDWYDFWEEEDHLALVIGDAAGSGIPAALLATLAMSAIRAEAAYRSDVAEVLRRANRAIVPHRMEDRFLTVFYGQLDLKTLRMRYVNAGHYDPILIRGGSNLLTLGSKKRTVLGAFEEPDLEVEEFQLEPGDRFFIYTDGVIECRDSRRRTFGENRLKRYLKSAGSRAAGAFVEDLVDVLNNFCGKRMEDDFTFLICDIKSQASE